MTTRKVTKRQAEAVLEQVAAWMGKRGYGVPICGHGKAYDEKRFLVHADGTDCDTERFGPAPTGQDAAHRGEGPMLLMEWDWPTSGPTPTIILEGGPYDWALEVGEAINVDGVWTEPYAGYALCIYRSEP